MEDKKIMCRVGGTRCAMPAFRSKGGGRTNEAGGVAFEGMLRRTVSCSKTHKNNIIRENTWRDESV